MHRVLPAAPPTPLLTAAIFSPLFQTARNSDVDHRIEADLIVVQKRSPTHRLVLNGKKLDDQMHTEGRGPGRRGEEPRKDPQTPPADAPAEDLDPLASSHIPVPRNRYSYIRRSLLSCFTLYVGPLGLVGSGREVPDILFSGMHHDYLKDTLALLVYFGLR